MHSYGDQEMKPSTKISENSLPLEPRVHALGAGSIWPYIMKMYETFCQNCEIYGPCFRGPCLRAGLIIT